MTIDAVGLMQKTFIARVEYRATVDSTNDRAAQLASQGVKELPLLVVADRQTTGRGRGANRWWTGEGSLAFSLLVEPQTVAADESRSPLVALAVAVAVADTVAPLLPSHRVGIHWPNDVLVECTPHTPCEEYVSDDRKLCGILVEVLPDRRHVIGIGLNVNNTLAEAPPELRNKAATIRDLAGREFDRTGVLIDLLGRLEREFAALRADPKILALRANELSLQRGQTLLLHSGQREVSGVCRGIAADGALLLETPSGVQAFYSGTTAAAI